jgi:ankyrin repeat protein
VARHANEATDGVFDSMFGSRDGESGWSPLHRSLHSGQLRIAAALLAANASLNLPDWRGRSPLDLLSVELKEYLAAGPDGAADGDVFAWGALRVLGMCGCVIFVLKQWRQCGAAPFAAKVLPGAR